MALGRKRGFMAKKVLKRIAIILSVIVFLVAGVILAYNFGWRLLGFSACNSPEDYTTYHYEIKENSIEYLFNKTGFHEIGYTLGYITEEKDGVLKIGIKYMDGIEGIFFADVRLEKLTIPITEKPKKIILCGNGYEIDIDDHVNEEFYQDYLDTLKQIEEQEKNKTGE